jgi:membrane protease YdiL (CAAX protease family)
MLVPALVLLITGAIHWQLAATPAETILTAVAAMLIVAVAEELLFRGFLFQRLIASLGVWPAQLIVAALFLLTHLQNPGMTGITKWIAGLNIFAASILFGFAYLRTRSLALPIGLHWMANVIQGPVLGVGVSGNGTAGALQPSFVSVAEWLTGGAFGLEASLPSTICVITAAVLFWRTTQTNAS